jgi:hypothetical protein
MKNHLSDVSEEKFDPIMHLGIDVDNLWEEQASRDREYEGDWLRRTYVRAVFAYIEASISFTKSLLLESANRAGHALTPAQSNLLSEESFTIGSKGEVESRPLFIPLQKNILFTMSLFKEFGLGNVVVRTDHESWSVFVDCLRFRHILTHPRPSDSLKVEDELLNKVRATEKWFNDDIMLQVAHIIYPHRKKEAEQDAT